MEAEILVSTLPLRKLFIGVKKKKFHFAMNFSFKYQMCLEYSAEIPRVNSNLMLQKFSGLCYVSNKRIRLRSAPIFSQPVECEAKKKTDLTI